MYSFIDFVIKEEELANKEIGHVIFDRIFLKRLRNNKPCVLILVGDSGEGKSHTALKIGEIFSKEQGLGDYAPYVNQTVIYTPMEYPAKMKELLNNKEMKKVNWVIIDEAREVVNASQWNSFINHAIADINATSRGIKPMCIIVVVQYLKDVDLRIRRTANYYGSCLRPMGSTVRLKLVRLWKDDNDIEKPRLRKRGIRGFLVKNKRYSAISPKIFKISRISKDVEEIYETNSKQAKKAMIDFKLNQLMVELQREYGGRIGKIEAAVEHFSTDFDNVIERHRGKFRVKKNIQKLLDFNKDELNTFENLLLKKLKEKGVANDGMAQQKEPVAGTTE